MCHRILPNKMCHRILTTHCTKKTQNLPTTPQEAVQGVVES
jgi:hypothetical protein